MGAAGDRWVLLREDRSVTRMCVPASEMCPEKQASPPGP
jgi:hypothetical protein